MALHMSLHGTMSSSKMSRVLPCPSVRRPAPFSSRALRLQVHAKKGKSAFRQRSIEPQQYRQLVKEYSGGPGAGSPPDVDPENEEFVIFLRDSTKPTNAWLPLTLVKGGTPANVLVQTMRSEWGKKLFQKVLIRNIAQAVYKGKDEVIKNLRKAQPMYINTPTSAFKFAMKIRDKTDASSWARAVDLTELPSESEVDGTPLDNIKTFFAREGLSF